MVRPGDFTGPWRTFATSETPDSHQYSYRVVGPWNHGGWFSGAGRTPEDVDFGSDTADYFHEHIQANWFAYWLKEKDKKPLNMSRIQLFGTGSNRWKAYDEWPPRGVQERKLYLHAAEEASIDPPQESGDAFDSFVSDPCRPVPYRERPIPDLRRIARPEYIAYR